MFRISQFQAVMKGFPRGRFDQIVQAHAANKHVKGFGAWDQLVAMVFAQCAGVTSLRTLEASFNQHPAQHYHLGTRRLRRSTLADANAKRPTAPLMQVARQLMASARRRVRRDCTPLLYLLDSTSLTLKGAGFDPWTSATATRHTQGMKVHVLYDAPGHVPCQIDLTAPNVNDIDHGRSLVIEAGATYVFDKGYCDYNWWRRIDAAKAWFVTRLKVNAGVQALQSRPIPAADRAIILADDLIRFRHRHPRAGHINRYDAPLRRVTVARPDHARDLVLVTNDMHSPASAIAARYRDRWQIELFFKWIKQHLRLTRFLGRSENAVRTQVLTALITYLLVSLYKVAQGFHGSLWMLLATLRVSLFQRPATEAAVMRRRQQRLSFGLRQGTLFG